MNFLTNYNLLNRSAKTLLQDCRSQSYERALRIVCKFNSKIILYTMCIVHYTLRISLDGWLSPNPIILCNILCGLNLHFLLVLYRDMAATFSFQQRNKHKGRQKDRNKLEIRHKPFSTKTCMRTFANHCLLIN